MQFHFDKCFLHKHTSQSIKTSKLVNKDVAVYIYNTVQNYIINRSGKVTCKC